MTAIEGAYRVAFLRRDSLARLRGGSARGGRRDARRRRHHAGDELRIVAPMLSRLANFDDADSAAAGTGRRLPLDTAGRPLPRDADVVILSAPSPRWVTCSFCAPGAGITTSSPTLARDGRILGLCGGYQMLGSRIEDAEGIDGRAGQEPGLGLLDVHTEMSGSKAVRPVAGRCVSTGLPVTGYEITLAGTTGKGLRAAHVRPRRPDGRARSDDGLIEGSYVHGVFTEDAFRRAWLRRAGATGRFESGLRGRRGGGVGRVGRRRRASRRCRCITGVCGEPILPTSGFVMTTVFGGALLMLRPG